VVALQPFSRFDTLRSRNLMTKLFSIFLALTAVVSAVSQTRQITPKEWKDAMHLKTGFPSNPAGGPYRMTFWSNSFEHGDSGKNSSRKTVTENFSASEGREHTETRIGTKISNQSDRIWKDRNEYERLENGKWTVKPNKGGQGQYRLGTGKGTDSTKPGPDGNPALFIRKPGSDEILYFALGERLYKRQVVTVYEEVTRHVLIRQSDQTEIHYENRTRHWLTDKGRMIRVDRNYVIYANEQTTRILSGYEWENDPSIKPIELPTN
jgi:hypothetical protein